MHLCIQLKIMLMSILKTRYIIHISISMIEIYRINILIITKTEISVEIVEGNKMIRSLSKYKKLEKFIIKLV